MMCHSTRKLEWWKCVPFGMADLLLNTSQCCKLPNADAKRVEKSCPCNLHAVWARTRLTSSSWPPLAVPSEVGWPERGLAPYQGDWGAELAKSQAQPIACWCNGLATIKSAGCSQSDSTHVHCCGRLHRYKVSIVSAHVFRETRCARAGRLQGEGCQGQR